MRPPWILPVLLAVGACEHPVPAQPPSGTSGAATASAPALPPGVLAELQGEGGPIRVEERDGLRLLTIAGVVQGGARIDAAAALAEADPMVALIRRSRPKARRVLVVGLGTGRTAEELARAGLEVEVVEQEPGVVDLARRFFGYAGPAVVGDGLRHLKEHAASFDVVLIDAFARAPVEVVRSAVEAGADDERRSKRLVAVRLLRSPADPAVSVLRRVQHFTHLFGSGVGDEEQNLILLASGAPLAMVHPEGLPLWPIPEAIEPFARPLATAVPGAPASRRVTLLGYLVRAREDGALCLDLPHEEMGALRYRLSGAALARMSALLPAGAKAPTAGEIRSDGDTKETLRELLGGGGWKRSDVRFSPVVVAVRGVATVAAIVHPDGALAVPAEIRGDAPNDPRLPYGGVLYDLAVEEVLWSHDHASWKKLSAKLRSLSHKAAATAAAGDLRQAAKIGENYLGAVAAEAGPVVARLPIHAAMKRVVEAITPEIGAGKGTPFVQAAACDRAHAAVTLPSSGSADAGEVLEGLRRCAEQGYEKARRSGAEGDRRVAAGRLLWLIGQRPFDSTSIDTARKDLDRIRGEHPDTPEIERPPDR